MRVLHNRGAANKMGILVNDVLVEEESKTETRTVERVIERPETTSENYFSKKRTSFNQASGCLKLIIILIGISCIIGIIASQIDNAPNKPTVRRNSDNTAQPKRETPRPDRQPTRGTPKRSTEWYEGGTLHKSTVTEWRRASVANKTATCADFAASVDNTVSMELLKLRVLQLELCIDEAVSDGSAEKLNLSTSDVAAMCIQILQSQEGNSTW